MLLPRHFIKFILLTLLFCITQSTFAQDTRSYVAWSPDGKMIASSSDTVLKVVNAEDLHVLNTVEGLNTAATAPVWSPDGSRLAIPNGTQVDVWQQPWDSNTARIQFSLTYPSGYIYALTWSPDGSKIVVGAANDDGTGDVWDVNSRQIIYRLEGHRDIINQFAWSPDGAWIATASQDRTIRLWNAADGILAKTVYIITSQPLPEDRAPTNSVSWNPTSTQVAIGAEDGTIRVWDRTASPLVQQGIDPVEPMVFHPYPDNLLPQDWITILSVAWSPDGNQIASGDENGNVIIWNAASGRQLQVIHAGSDWVYSVAWDYCGEKLAYSGEDGLPVVLSIPSVESP